jgi:arsenate reductase (thioredoxin)
MRKQTVLFLCTGNSARSQIAEGLLRHLASDTFDVFSAGIEPKGINPYTTHVMNEAGIDISGQRSKQVKEYMGQMFFDYLITVCSDAEQNCPQALWSQGGKKLHWYFDDPAAVEGTDEEKLAKFQDIRDQIEAKLKVWLEEMHSQPA